MKIALLQLNPIVGDVLGNEKKILEAYKRALKRGAELVVSTELVLLGYPPRDLLERKDLLRAQWDAVKRIAKQTTKPLIVGVAEENRIISGNKLFNSAVVLRDGAIMAERYRKQLLPTYDVFDELRHFAPWRKERQELLAVGDKKFAVLICEDIWADVEEAQVKRIYDHDPVDALSSNIDGLIVLNASPYYWGKSDVRLNLLKDISQRINAPVIYSNQVGANDELIFDGGSLVVGDDGVCVDSAAQWREDVLVVDLFSPSPTSQREHAFSTQMRRTSFTEPAGDTDSLGAIHKALTLGINDYVVKTGAFPGGAVLGLSGGIDSALVACLARDALGAENVKTFAMPSKFSSKESLEDARLLASNLGITLEEISIESAYAAFGDALRPSIGWEETIDITEENVQSRIRGLLLMAKSNREHSIVLGTGNKSELAMGYATLYGDMAAGLLVIADLPKTLVYRLCEYLSCDGEVIPKRILTKPPSAELRPDQKDSDSLPPYDVLDAILHDYIEERLGPEALIAKGYDSYVVERVVSGVDSSEFKRRQAAPSLRITGKAFGMGRRLPIAAKIRI